MFPQCIPKRKRPSVIFAKPLILWCPHTAKFYSFISIFIVYKQIFIKLTILYFVPNSTYSLYQIQLMDLYESIQPESIYQPVDMPNKKVLYLALEYNKRMVQGRFERFTPRHQVYLVLEGQMNRMGQGGEQELKDLLSH